MLPNDQVRLVYPIAEIKWLVHISKSGEFIRKRKSPKKGKLTDLFYELVYTPHLIRNSNFSLEVLLIEEEELRCQDGKGSWRRRGVSVKDRKLLNVFSRVIFENNRDFLRFLPDDMVEPFTNKTLANNLGVSIRLAQKITYCLRKMGILSIVGKKKKESLFKVSAT